jgi:2-dehydropantoate 2-reductase
MTHSNQPLRILSFGAGAIGTYIGGSLALNGNHVVFLERPDTAARIDSLLLTIEGCTRTLTQPVMTSSLGEALEHGPFDIALFALKSFDTKIVVGGIEPFKDQMPPILCLQNGVENEDAIAKVLGADKVIHGTITSAVGKPGPGQIILERFRGMGISANHPLAAKLETAFEQAGLGPVLISPPEAMKWSKMLTNLISNASSAILDMPPGEVFNHPGLYRLEIEQIREALRVMDAMGIPAVDLPGTPVKALAFAANSLPLSISRPLLRRAIGGGRGEKMPSFHIDLHSGRGKSEVGYLNGAVGRFGADYGVPTPVNDFLTKTLTDLVAQKIPISKYQKNPEGLLNSFANHTP